MNLKDKTKKLVRNMLMRLYSFHNENSVFFVSFSGKQYSDSPKVISEYLHSVDPRIGIYWMVNESIRKQVPDYAHCVAPSTTDALKAQARSKVWVSNTTLAAGTFKPSNVFYIQTWHGDRGFKLCGYDAARVMNDNYSKSHIEHVEEKICDLYLVGSDFGEEVGRSGLGYGGEYLKVGIPRNDVLVRIGEKADDIEKIKANLGLEDKKLLLYAPTFRDKNRDIQTADVDLSKCLDILCCPEEEWVCLIRAHSATKYLELGAKDPRIVDVSSYPDMADLLLIADILITDYSSSISDYILTGRPCFLAQFDREGFEAENRTLYFNPEESGYLIAHNQKELETMIKNIHSYDFNVVRDRVNAFYGTYETGKATETVCERILKHLQV